MISDAELIDLAVQARNRAYAPYSNFPVGAALGFESDQAIIGVNVENCSYGLTVCAERNAIANAVVDGALPGELKTVVIASDAPEPTPPCGACRQVLAEFGNRDVRVLLYNVKDETTEEVRLGDLLPRAFTRSSMP